MEKARKAPDYDEARMILTHINAIASLRYCATNIRNMAERMTPGNSAHHRAAIQIEAQTINNYLEMLEADLKQLETIRGVLNES